MGREAALYCRSEKILQLISVFLHSNSSAWLCNIQFSSNFDLSFCLVLIWFFCLFFSLPSPSFQDFDVQGSRRCSSDWLTIGSYKNIEGYRACGSSIPSPYISSQDHVWIRFHSDDSISRKGFRLAYFAGMFQMILSSVLRFHFFVFCFKN